MVANSPVESISGSVAPSLQPNFSEPKYANIGGREIIHTVSLKNTSVADGSARDRFWKTSLGFATSLKISNGEISLTITLT